MADVVLTLCCVVNAKSVSPPPHVGITALGLMILIGSAREHCWGATHVSAEIGWSRDSSGMEGGQYFVRVGRPVGMGGGCPGRKVG